MAGSSAPSHRNHNRLRLPIANRIRWEIPQPESLVSELQTHDRMCTAPFQKNPRVRKIRVRNSGAGNGCADFMDAWKKCVRSAGKTMSIKFLVLGGGYFGFGGGGSADFIFMGARIFLTV